jgi:hypothetical protein
MFSYCREVLRLSEDAAYNRIKAARAARAYPAIVGMLADGVAQLRRRSAFSRPPDVENHEALLAAAAGKGKQDVEVLLARWFPQPDVAPSVRKLPKSLSRPPQRLLRHRRPPAVPRAVLTPASDRPPRRAPSRPALVRPSPPSATSPIHGQRGDPALMREAQDLLGHAVPTGDLAVVFHRALTVLVADLKRRKFGRPRAATAANVEAASGMPPAAVRRAGRRARRESLRIRLQDMGAAATRRASWSSTTSCRERPAVRHRRQHPAPLSRAQRHEVDLFFGPGKRWVKGDRRPAPPLVIPPSGGYPSDRVTRRPS